MMTLKQAEDRSRGVLNTLAPFFKSKAMAWYESYLRVCPRILVLEGTRSMARQEELFKIGRTEKNPEWTGTGLGPIVTKATPGHSFHNYGAAFDWVPLVPSAKHEGLYYCEWNLLHDYKAGDGLAKLHGIRPIAWETGHLEDADFVNWEDLAKHHSPILT